jgi:predicted ATP-grasp superfamily ATP-dependent carboligase
MTRPRSDDAPDRRPPLVLLGGSVRALAESAHRAGFDVHAADLFRDLDTIACARQAVSVAADGEASDRYPWSLRTAAAAFPVPAVWCYSGALENHPAVIAAIAAERPLAGVPADVVRRLRDRRRLAAAARAAGLHAPLTLASPAGVPLDGSFLVKPRHGAGGRGIYRWTAAARAACAAGAKQEPVIWQQLAPGLPISAAYLMAPDGSRLLGATLQFVGCAWCRAADFAWCGGVAVRPGTEADPCRPYLALLARLGDELAARFGPRGVLGVDCIAMADGRVLVLEVNPRPTASMELHERLGAGSIAGLHVAACGLAAGGPPAAPDRTAVQPASGPAAWSKAILFAAAPTPIAEQQVAAVIARRDAWTVEDGGWAAVSDLPRPGQTIPARAPILTVFAPGGTADDAVAAVRGRVAAIARLFPDGAGQPAIRCGTDALAAGATKCIR